LDFNFFYQDTLPAEGKYYTEHSEVSPWVLV
jgi:hypothetical protein